jgi:primosomal protein N' (replication factor Y)
MREQSPGSGIFSPTLLNRLEANVESGFQSIIFLNKRGHARFIQCRSCGWVAECRNCDITLTYHRIGRRLRCHFCGLSRAAPTRCEKCGGAKILFSGVGTQQVELELEGLFPGVGIIRMDADTTSGKEGHRRILERFSTGRFSILIGTQMVTKGHHFPGVSLVGVLHAEEGLNFPDFRSAEKTFQILTQVSGRAGRAGRRGEVIIQTYMPDHYVFKFLKSHNYNDFIKEELAIRKRLSYPPFARLILATCVAANPDTLSRVVSRWVDGIRPVVEAKKAQLLGPCPPLVARLNNRYREQVLIKGRLSGRDKQDLLAEFDRIAGHIPGARSVELKWDVDPESFL